MGIKNLHKLNKTDSINRTKRRRLVFLKEIGGRRAWYIYSPASNNSMKVHIYILLSSNNICLKHVSARYLNNKVVKKIAKNFSLKIGMCTPTLKGTLSYQKLF